MSDEDPRITFTPSLTLVTAPYILWVAVTQIHRWKQRAEEVMHVTYHILSTPRQALLQRGVAPDDRAVG